MNKFGQYLPVILAALALVMLLFIAAGNPSPAEPTLPTTGSDSQSIWDPGPETQEEPEQMDAMTRVEQALYSYPLDETAMAVCVYDHDLHADPATRGLDTDAHSNALARLCDEQRMNPVAAFWLLEKEELYAYAPEGLDTIPVPAFSLPMQVRREYPFTAEGTRALLTDLLTLSGSVEDGLQMDARLLGENGQVDADQVFYEEGDCYYAYFVYYGQRSAHFLCFYLRGSGQISDLEFQLLNLRYADGDEEALNRIDQLSDRQAASMMAAAEQLLTGTSRADEGRIPLSYSLDGGSAVIERFAITGYGETGTLTNYALHVGP